MPNKITNSLYALLLAVLFQPVQAAEQQQADAIDARALSLLKKTTEHLTKTDQFNMVLAYSYDAVQASGQTIELGGTRKVSIDRPDKARIEFTRRDGLDGTMIYDGKTVTIQNDKLNVYTQIRKQGTIGDVMDTLAEKIDIPIPARDLFSEKATSIMTNNLLSATYVGEASIDNVKCEHIAFQTADVDFQLWVSGNDPLPRRLVINYKNHYSQPQFRANFLEWNMRPTFAKTAFSFTPAKGAEKIPLIIRTGSDSDEGRE